MERAHSKNEDRASARKGNVEGDKQHIDQAPGKSKSVSEEDKKLNEALKESFPASDPPASGQATGREPPKSRIDRQPAPIIPPEPMKEKK